MRKLLIILVLLSCTTYACQRKGCVSYDKKTGEYKVSDKPKEKSRGLMPKNPRRAF
jgi:hypothetical protein